MDNQVPASQSLFVQQAVPPEPPMQNGPLPTMPDVETMKAEARDRAIQQLLAARMAMPAQPSPSVSPLEPKVVYVRRNLTVAELILVFAVACGVVIGVPNLWNFATNRLPQVEIKVK